MDWSQIKDCCNWIAYQQKGEIWGVSLSTPLRFYPSQHALMKPPHSLTLSSTKAHCAQLHTSFIGLTRGTGPTCSENSLKTMKSLSNFGFLAVSPSEPGLKALKPAAGGALGPEWDIVATGQSCWQRNLWAWFNRPPTF